MKRAPRPSVHKTVRGARAESVATYYRCRMNVHFDMAALRRAAGDTTFLRGEAYHRQDKVRIAAIDGERVLARVEGNESYRVELHARGGAIGGRCSCPAFESAPVCKHMVAAALAAEGLAPDSEAAGAIARIRAHLTARGVDALVDMIVELAEDDDALFEKLDLAAAVAGTDDAALERRLAAALDAATDVGEHMGYEGAGTWAERIDGLLDAIADLMESRPAIALRLIDGGIDDLAESLDAIDDSNGECAGLLERAQDIHLAATRKVRPDPIELAGSLYARETDDGLDAFWDAATLYADVLGESGLAAYRALAEADWAKLPTRTASTGGHSHVPGYVQLMHILDGFAARDDDVATRLKLRTKDLSTQGHYLGLVSFCREQGLEAEALRWAEEGLFMFEDARRDDGLVTATVELLARAGREDEAEAMLWSAFRKSPSLYLYDKLRKAGGAGARDEVVGFLRKRAAGEAPRGFVFPADLLVEVLLREKAMDAAWAAVAEFRASRDVRTKLAAASETTHPEKALAVHSERVEELVGTSRYHDAIALIERMGRLRDAEDQRHYVSALKARHGRKRNLMKLLG